MHFLDVTLATIEANLALEEVLLEQAECGELDTEVLRIWEPPSTAVVLGRSSRVADEVDTVEALKYGIPILRRSSGGASVVIAPGCLAYALLLSYEARPAMRMIDAAHRFVTAKIVAALSPLQSKIRFSGTCDLVVDERKVSGNSVRCRRDWLLYHGTLLVDMDLSLVDRYLKHPPREPEYRHRRPHRDFLANLDLPRTAIVERLLRTWECSSLEIDIPHHSIARLLAEKYSNRSWNFQR